MKTDAVTLAEKTATVAVRRRLGSKGKAKIFFHVLDPQGRPRCGSTEQWVEQISGHVHATAKSVCSKCTLDRERQAIADEINANLN